ncbi:MAG: hypothetical protein JW944_08605 [Deltaproteobacteria bacterium]|nr:hypothetical protein [Deltaproteobacteria bacterium]
MFEQNYRRELHVEVSAGKCKEAIERLRSQHAVLGHYPTVRSLRDLVNPKNEDYEDKDQVMTILLSEMARDNAIYPLINLMFWENLMGLFGKWSRWALDKEALFHEIHWEFFHVVMEYDLRKYPSKIPVHIFLNTKKRVLAWADEERQQNVMLQEIKELNESGYNLTDFHELNIRAVDMEQYLIDLVYRRIINDTQYDLLLETRVLRKFDLKDWCAKRGIEYNTARSLRYRAETAIRDFERTRQKEI